MYILKNPKSVIAIRNILVPLLPLPIPWSLFGLSRAFSAPFSLLPLNIFHCLDRIGFFSYRSDKFDHILSQLFFHITITNVTIIIIIFKFRYNFLITYQLHQQKNIFDIIRFFRICLLKDPQSVFAFITFLRMVSSSSARYSVAYWFSLLLIFPAPSKLGTFISSLP